jgi:hypothetical protein
MNFNKRTARRYQSNRNWNFPSLESRILLSGIGTVLDPAVGASNSMGGILATTNGSGSTLTYQSSGYIGPAYGYLYGYPQDDHITANATIRPIGGELLFGTFLVYNSSVAESAISVHNHDSAVPFDIRGSSNGPVRITITDSNGIPRPSVLHNGGEFGFIHIDTTMGKGIGAPVTVKVKVETLTGRNLLDAEGTDKVVGEELEIAKELVRLRPKAFQLVQSQAKQQSQSIIKGYFTEERILAHAQELHGQNPTGPSVGEIVDEINETHLPAMQTQLAILFSNAGNKSVELLMKGDWQVYRFKAAETSKTFPEFAKGMREVQNGIDMTETKLKFGLDTLPDFDSFKNWNQPSDFRNLFNQLQPTAEISAPIKFEGNVLGSIGATASGVSFQDLAEQPLSAIERLDLSASAGIRYERGWDVDTMFWGSRFRAKFGLGIEGSMKMTPIDNGQRVPRFWEETENSLMLETQLNR